MTIHLKCRESHGGFCIRTGLEPQARNGQESRILKLRAALQLIIVLNIVLGVFLLGGILFSADPPGGTPLFIGDLEKEKDAWIGKSFRVEGRISFVDRTQLKLRNSSILFRSKTALRTFSIKPVNLIVTGEFQLEGTHYVFEISSIDSEPGDPERLARRRIELDRDVPQDYYDLAAWASSRGLFYQDAKMTSAAEELNQQGFKIEWKHLADDDGDGRMALAHRGIEQRIPDGLRQELMHEGYQVRIKGTEKLPEPKWEQLVAEVVRDFPGAEGPLSDDPQFLKLRKDYLVSPQRVYREANAETRLRLHRVLWGELKRREVMDRVQRSPERGIELANEFERLVPEYRTEADKLRDQLLMLRGQDVEKLTRSELIALRDDFVRRQQEAAGNRLVEEWLAFRKKKLTPNDLEGLLQLASDYENLSRDAGLLAPSLLEASRSYPQSQEISTALVKLGYQLVDGKWISAAERDRQAKNPKMQELRDGVIAIGMTASEVRKSQGSPSSLSRIASLGELQEIWVYGHPGGQGGFTVHLRRGDQDTQAKVIAIDDLPAR